jgi:hypothetical protein
MTLTHLLEINSRLLKPEEFASVAIAERTWRALACPTGARELIDLLEKVLSECGQCGIRYAPIFLQRKKALLRGTWSPQVRAAPFGGGANGGNPNDGTCSMCRGSGYVLIDGGRGATLCACDKWTKQQKVG